MPERSDCVNLGQGIYEEAYKKNFIEQYLKIVKKELGIDKIRELLIDLLIKGEEDTGVYDRASALDAIDAYAPELLSEKKDAMVLIKEMREQAYTDGFVIGAYDEMKEYDMSDDKIRASLIKMVQEQPKCGVHSQKQAEIVVDDILINRMDEIREVLARTERKKECQE